MSGDKNEIEQHIEFNKSGMEKLNKMTSKHQALKQKQENNFQDQAKTIHSMLNQIKILEAEKNNTLESIAQHRRELADLKK
mmetsp:Transcript_5439/g.8432  ORF Transcript_5439/g.8432 Transcript_5439/m.8432 type:complete len:81 (+) Transcript_5439:1565-1807(+)